VNPLRVGIVDDKLSGLSTMLSAGDLDIVIRRFAGASVDKQQLLSEHDVIAMRLQDGMEMWSLLTGAVERLLADRLLALFVVADDTTAIEGLFASTAHWPGDGAALQAYRSHGRLLVKGSADVVPNDLRNLVERVRPLQPDGAERSTRPASRSQRIVR
jgi:hypothetical protein